MAAIPPCPNCGQPCTVVLAGPLSAPWVCFICSRGWFQAEVDAAAHWNPTTRSFTDDQIAVVDAAVLVELDAADVRGIAAPLDQIAIQPTPTLETLVVPGVLPPAGTITVQTVIDRRLVV